MMGQQRRQIAFLHLPTFRRINAAQRLCILCQEVAWFILALLLFSNQLPAEQPESSERRSIQDVLKDVSQAHSLLRTDLDAAASQAIQVLGDHSDLPPKIEAMTRWIAGSALSRTSQHAEAMVHLERGEQVARELDDPKYLRRLLRYIAASSYELNDFQRGRDAATEALKLTARIDDSDNGTYEATLLNELGGCETRLGNLEAASEAFLRALQIAQNAGDANLESMVLTNLVDVHCQLRVYDEAETICREILARDVAKLTPQVEASARLQLAHVLRAQKRTSDAEQQLTKILAELPASTTTPVAMIASGQLGELLEDRGETEKAETYYKKAIAFAHQVNDEAGVAEFQYRVTRVQGLVDAETDFERTMALRQKARERLDIDSWIQHSESAIAIARKLEDPAKTLQLVDELRSHERLQWTSLTSSAIAKLQKQIGTLQDQQQQNEQRYQQEVSALQEAEQATRSRWMSLLIVSLVIGVLALSVMLVQLRSSLRRERRASEKVKIQERRQKELERRMAREEKVSSLKLFAGGIVHDFNNLLAAITSSADYGSQLTSSADRDATFQNIAQAAEQASELTSQLTQYLGGASSQKGTAALGPAIRQMKPLLKSVVKNRADLQVADHSQGEHVGMGSSEARQIVVNLVSNAAESMDEKGLISVQVQSVELQRADIDKFRAERSDASCFEHLVPGAYCHLSVMDTGCGMDDQTLKRIFDPYFSTKDTGHGLGMASVQGIVKSSEGVAFAHSTAGEGTIIDVFLPVVQAVSTSESKHISPQPTVESDEAKHAEAEPQTNDRTGNALRILVVDDESMIRDMVGRILKLDGHMVDLACDADEARSLFATSADNYDCVIADFSMPGEDGLSLLEWIRGKDSEIRTILCSGFHQEGVQDEDFVDQCMQKPFRADALLAAVGQLKSVEMTS